MLFFYYDFFLGEAYLSFPKTREVLKIFKAKAKPKVVEILKKSWKKSWKVVEFVELERVRTM